MRPSSSFASGVKWNPRPQQRVFWAQSMRNSSLVHEPFICDEGVSTVSRRRWICFSIFDKTQPNRTELGLKKRNFFCRFGRVSYQAPRDDVYTHRRFRLLFYLYLDSQSPLRPYLSPRLSRTPPKAILNTKTFQISAKLFPVPHGNAIIGTCFSFSISGFIFSFDVSLHGFSQRPAAAENENRIWFGRGTTGYIIAHYVDTTPSHEASFSIKHSIEYFFASSRTICSSSPFFRLNLLSVYD